MNARSVFLALAAHARSPPAFFSHSFPSSSSESWAALTVSTLPRSTCGVNANALDYELIIVDDASPDGLRTSHASLPLSTDKSASSSVLAQENSVSVQKQHCLRTLPHA
ncbi:hypothetical protein CF328_g6301 [Tilletia controversa]|uniref:Glycosyltransferase 2-like domain-containing protein n=1 Tax=Tilletia caries TaxID=13290 RepID=A0ABN7IXU7_9BASI|nr:hypothetical protein CF328_g6301 [Tilletia controversa]KAE8193098.1 hypothetical protein CF335_g5681 [Tilletia laevis]CAD6937223.1 unnamed protein product [Tilletia caries]